MTFVTAVPNSMLVTFVSPRIAPVLERNARAEASVLTTLASVTMAGRARAAPHQCARRIAPAAEHAWVSLCLSRVARAARTTISVKPVRLSAPLVPLMPRTIVSARVHRVLKVQHVLQSATMSALVPPVNATAGPMPRTQVKDGRESCALFAAAPA